ncbi:hypothetical protein [Williamsia sp. CHRR-6]|uniref:hypothetical protein n=1 Tax=Williamsia sp. CHRR-6 TaxID=2835871 RepID=UPI001BD9616F|nr:hypothetical protein [Williamsia sp. CHRR-6]MBT0566068.1 hypothetical protein [Williamsia sp. CHRR-6]
MSSSHGTQSIKYFGTSWASRGFTYWRKRVVMTTFLAALLALSVWGAAVIIHLVATHMRGTGRITLLVFLLLALAWSLAYGFALTRRTAAEKELGVPPIMRARSSSESRTRAGWSGVGAGIVAGPLVLIAQIFIVGTLAAAVFSSLQQYVSIEEFEAATGKRVPRRDDSDYASLTIIPVHRQ